MSDRRPPNPNAFFSQYDKELTAPPRSSRSSKKEVGNTSIPNTPGYFDYKGESRYTDGEGRVFFNHSGPALNTLGNLDPRKYIKGYVDNNPLVTDADGKSRVAGSGSSSSASTTPGTAIPPRLNTGRGAMFMDPVGPAPKMPGASSFMDPVAPKDADVTQLATKPGRQDNDVALVPDSTVYSGRDDSRVSPTGVAQKGTNMSRSFNDLLATTNTSGYQPYSSNQLPTTQANPFSAQPPKTQSFDVAAPGVTGNSYDNYGADGGVAAASSTDKSQFTPMSGKEERIEGASDRKKGGSLDDALNDKAGINSYMSKFSSGAQERAANRAFLDTEDSMLALRAKEAVNGVVYAQGKHYVSGKSGDDPAVAIDRSAARDISNGKETASGASQKAQDFLNNKKAEVTAAAKQEPTTLKNAASSQAFQQDKPMSATMPGDIGNSVEFDLNNDNAIKPFGAPKGYSSGFKRIDTSIPNPFG